MTANTFELRTAAAYAAYPDMTDCETGEPMDDYGYAAQGREGFHLGWLAALEQTGESK